MPGFLLTSASTILCTHGGSASVSPSNTVVEAGAPILVESDVHTVAGCPFMIGNTPSPCVQIAWSAGAAKVAINGTPALVQSSVGQCKAATGAVQGVAIIASTQAKVDAQ
jgi:hypothetical protein